MMHRLPPLLLLLLLAPVVLAEDLPPDLLTVAEATDYRGTATHAEVMTLSRRLADRSPRIELSSLGRTYEGRDIPLLIIADPPVADAEAARASGKAIVFAFGAIHAGEICGKEALLMLAREIALADETPWLDELILLVAPVYNADGNDRMSPDNRRGQLGPVLGMGQRPNAQGLDLNRDYVKLESPEARALVALLTEWDPHLTIDTHTTNGSHHRYTLTYDYPLNPSGPAGPIALVRDELLPAVARRLRERTGYDTFFYGNFDRAYTTWTTYSAMPRFGGPYQGLRGQASILSEAHAYAPYRDRVLCTREFLREIFDWAAAHRRRLMDIRAAARAEVVAAGADPRPDDVVGLRHRPAAWDRPAIIRGWDMRVDPATGRMRPTDTPVEYRVVHRGRFEPTLSVRRPHAYLLRGDLDGVVEKLRQHGVVVRRFSGRADVEAYTIRRIGVAPRVFQGHQIVSLDVDAQQERDRRFDDAWLVPLAQPLGTLAVYLLEPQSEDGLAAWNFFDDLIEEGGVYPVWRVANGAALRSAD